MFFSYALAFWYGGILIDEGHNGLSSALQRVWRLMIVCVSAQTLET